MPIDLPDHKLWLPPKPAIIRSVGDIRRRAWLPGVFPVPVGGGLATLTFLQASTPITGAHNPATFSNVNIGPAASDRYVVMIMQSQTAVPGRSLSSVTIGGSTPTSHVSSASVIAAANTLLTLMAGILIPAGTTATFALYVLINGAMVMGLAPVVGVPMPMLSYGGTVMLTVMIGFGLVQAVRVQRYSEVTSGKGALM